MDIRQGLGDGLVLRRTTKRDTDALVDLQANAFANPDTGEPDKYLGGWTRDLMGGKHPTFRPDDFFVVEDTTKGILVSCVCLISQTWTMDGISFGVGQPEIVGTHSAYRNRGLVRALFQALHQVSAERGELVQGITGISYFYRQFGYEYALELGYSRRTYIPQQIPGLKNGEREQFRMRRAKRADLEFVKEMYDRAARRSLLHCERDVERFEFEHFKEKNPLNGNVSWWDIVETRKGQRAGILFHRQYIYRGQHKVLAYEVHPDFKWEAVTPFVLRELVRQGAVIENVDGKPLAEFVYFLSSNHPVFELMGEHMAPFYDPYAWYLRVPDLPAFLKKIAPMLEKRLAPSVEFQAYSGTLRLNFFKSGIELTFEGGKIKDVIPWHPTASENDHSGFGNAAFPDLTFLKLVFGYRTRREVEAMFPDCNVDSRQNGALLDTLFPKKVSHVVHLH